jgi:uncharacterized protein
MQKIVASSIRPAITEINRGFWEGCVQGKLLIQRCARCQYLRYPPSMVCPRCLATQYSWYQVSGRGTVFSFVIFHRSYHPDWESRIPYNVCLIELEEGPMMLSNVLGVDNSALAVGMAVTVAFQRIADDLTIPVFEPCGARLPQEPGAT